MNFTLSRVGTSLLFKSPHHASMNTTPQSVSLRTCGKVLFELDMPHVKQNPSVSSMNTRPTGRASDSLFLHFMTLYPVHTICQTK